MAGFLGRCNAFPGVMEPGGFRVGAAVVPGVGAPGAGTLVVRPERVRVGAEGALPGRVAMVTYLGGLTEWHVATDAGPVIATAPTPAADESLRRVAVGDTVRLDWRPEHGRLLPASGESA